ncbi:MFS transporter [Limosilactobacillus secaliphilus]|nr:MFS transporter [Limosilactobacillus secaliphilus]
MSRKNHKITNWTRIAYGCGHLMGNSVSAMSGVWMLYFFTTFGNLSAKDAATIFSVGTLLQGFANPIIAFISDNFNATRLGRRFGRRRFWIMIGAPLMLTYPLQFIPHMGYWYYFFAYAIFEMIYTMTSMPYGTLSIEMTKSFKERNYLVGYGEMIAKIANFGVAALPGLVFSWLGKESANSFLIVACILCLIMMTGELLVYFNTWELPPDQVKTEYVDNWWEGIKKLFIDYLSTLRCRAFRRQLMVYMFGQGSEGLFAAVFTYFVVFALQKPASLVSGIQSMNSIIQLCSTAVFMIVISRKGFKWPFTIAMSAVICTCVAYACLYWFHISSVVAIIIISVIFATFTGGVFYTPHALYPFIPDVDEALTDRRREGVYSAAMGLCGKLMNAIYVLVLGYVLEQAGFVKGAKTQPVSAVHAIVGVLTIGVGFMAIVGIIGIWRLNLNKERHKILLDEIARVHAGGSMKDVTPEARAVVEDLTGWKYEQCFGHNNVGYKGSKKDREEEAEKKAEEAKEQK